MKGHDFGNSLECKLEVVKMSGARNSLPLSKFQTRTFDIVVVNFFIFMRIPRIVRIQRFPFYTFVSVKLSRRSLHNAESVLYETFFTK